MKQLRRWFLLCASFGFLSGCGAGETHVTEGETLGVGEDALENHPGPPIGGFVKLVASRFGSQPGGAVQQAEFYESVTPDRFTIFKDILEGGLLDLHAEEDVERGPLYGILPVDSCRDFSEPPIAPPTTNVKKDVGPTVTLSAPGSTIVLQKGFHPAIQYGAGVFSNNLLFDQRYEITLAGAPGLSMNTYNNAFTVLPPFVDVISPNLDQVVNVVAGQPFEVTWVPAGRAEVLVQMSARNAGFLCRVRDNGSFTFTADQTLKLPSRGTIAVTAWIRTLRRQLEGREISHQGTSGVLGTFARQ